MSTADAKPATLHLFCGRIAAGKSTLARQLAAGPATLLIALDDWTSVLYPTEMRTIDDFWLLTARIRQIMGPHVVAILKQGISISLDFPANTVQWRSWMRTLIDKAGVAHQLHLLDVPDMICRERLRQRNASGGNPYQVDEATYDVFMQYFVPPAPDEGFNIVVHSPASIGNGVGEP